MAEDFFDTKEVVVKCSNCPLKGNSCNYSDNKLVYDKVTDVLFVLEFQEDRKILEGLELPENSIYEDLIVIDLGDFVIECFMYRGTYLDGNRVKIVDYKTGSIVKKSSFYSSKDYKQTGVYAYAKDIEGYSVVDCGVIMLDRAGNNSPKSPIRLTGKVEYIETPYNKKEIENFLNKDVRKIAKEISNYYSKYLELLS